ncbi:MAG: hypothetical protein KGJ56_03560 [Gammaproteobacteria bacterium]|nr:hypothetical protein [Gammaproteobacteria bacterium]
MFSRQQHKDRPDNEIFGLIHHSLIRDLEESLSNLFINLVLGFIASLLMLHLHQDAYRTFENYMTAAVDPGIVLVLAPVSMILIGVEFLFLAVTPYRKGRVPRLFVSLILGVKGSIVVVSGLSLGMACAAFFHNPDAAMNAFIISLIYFMIAFFLAFTCFAPFYTDLNGFKSRIAFIVVGLGFPLLATYYPYVSGELFRIGTWFYPANAP